MDTFKSFERYLDVVNAETFDEIALELFRFQGAKNPVYKSYLEALGVSVHAIKEVKSIPFLPIRFFKEHLIKTGVWTEELLFTSSGTTGVQTSAHAVYNQQLYLRNAQSIFESQFGSLSGYHILALLPSYLDRKGSSLVSMIDHFIKQTQSVRSGFYLHNQEQLVADVENLRTTDRKVIVWGVTYALLDVTEKYSPDWRDVLLFETGGMKGKRKEITREELHTELISKLNVGKVFSEYGMTELFSQAYTQGGSTFNPGNTLKVLIRDLTDPFRAGLVKETGGINVIDLANFSTISFIETEDIGKLSENGTFEVLGRMDNSDVRGCNLLVE